MIRRSLRLLAKVTFAFLWLVTPNAAVAADDTAHFVRVEQSYVGALIQNVTVETYGVTKPDVARQYLSLKAGDRLEQFGVNRDYQNLETLCNAIPRLDIEPGTEPNTVILHWIVMVKWLEPTKHPFYGDQPLQAPIQGVGFILTGPPMSRSGSNISSIAQLSRRANLVRFIYTAPLHVNPVKGRESDFIFNVFGGRGVYRASAPLAINIYSWNTGAEAVFYQQGTNHNQFELGMRTFRTTTSIPTGIVAPSLYMTNIHPGRLAQLEGGYSHNCGVPSTQWVPPFCSLQYRFQALDSIGILGATSEYQQYLADVAQYNRIGTSALVFHGGEVRTGGVLPDSFLVCENGLRGYPKPFCGTDAQIAQAEFRIAQAVPGPLHWVVFTETASSRIRGGNQPFAPFQFQWYPDSGFGLIYRGLRLDLAWGKQGGRFTVELQGQTF